MGRSTITAVLSRLTSAGWLERQPDKTYALGWGLTHVADAAQTRLSLLGAARQELQAITDDTGYGCALSRVSEFTLEFLVLTGGPERLPPGVRTGARLRLRPPAGAGHIAFRPQREQQRWLSEVPESNRDHLGDVLAAMRDTGLGIWRLEGNHGELFKVLSEVTSVLDANPAHIAAPVLDARGHTGYELEVGLLRTDVPATEVRDCMERIRTAATSWRPACRDCRTWRTPTRSRGR